VGGGGYREDDAEDVLGCAGNGDVLAVDPPDEECGDGLGEEKFQEGL
jgi:hypothetical protein